MLRGNINDSEIQTVIRFGRRKSGIHWK